MTDGLDYLGRARMQGLTLLVLAFLVGVLAGAAGDRLVSRPRPPEPPPRSHREGPPLPRVLEEMNLTPSQRAAIDSILAAGRPRNEAIMNEVLPRLRAVGDSLQQDIRAVLTPAQAAEFDAYLRAHRGNMMTPPPPPRPNDGPGGPPREGERDRRPPPPPPRDGFRGPPGGGPPDGGPPPGEPPPPPPGERR